MTVHCSGVLLGALVTTASIRCVYYLISSSSFPIIYVLRFWFSIVTIWIAFFYWLWENKPWIPANSWIQSFVSSFVVFSLSWPELF